MTIRRRVLFAALLLLVVAAAAALLLRGRGVGPARGFDAAQVMAASCDATLVVPDLGRAGEGLIALQRLRLAALAAPLAGAASPDAFATDLARQIGFDLRSRDSMRSVGIDPSRPLFAQNGADGTTVVAVPMADAGKLEAFLATQAANRLGATQRAEQRIGDARVVTASGAGAAAPMAAWTRLPGYELVVAGGSDPLARMRGALATVPASSLAGDARFAASRERFSNQTLFAYACAGSPTTRSLNLPYSASAAVSIGAAQLALSVDVPLSDAMATSLATLGQSTGAEVAGRLDPQAFATLRFGGDPAQLKPYASDLIPSMFRSALAQAKIDVADEILGNLQPGIALALSLAPSARFDAMPQLDPRRTNPFEYVQLEALGRVKDAAKAQAVLDKVAAVAPKFGATIAPHDVAGHTVFTTRYGLGEGASLAVVDGYAAVTGGPNRMEKLISRLGAPALTAANAPGVEFTLDIAQLTKSVRALPDSAFGVGGFAVRAAMSRWLDAVEELRSMKLRARVEQKSLRGELSLALAPAAPATANGRSDK